MSSLSQIENHEIFEVSWPECQVEVANVNPALADLINAINPDSQLRFLKVRYRFGEIILKNNQWRLPTKSYAKRYASANNQLTLGNSINHHHPVAILLNKRCELFIDSQGQIIPKRLMQAGELIGTQWLLPESFNHNLNIESSSYHSKIASLSLTAGSRSLLLLSKMSDGIKCRQLCHGLKIPRVEKPTSLLAHWQFLKSLTYSSYYPDDWFCDLLFFPTEWALHSDKTLLPIKLSNYLYKEALSQQYQLYAFMTLPTLIHYLSKKTNQWPCYQSETIHHLLRIAHGISPALMPIDFNDANHINDAAPITWLSEILNEYYRPKYTNHFMYADTFGGDFPVYYSLNMPHILGLHKNIKTRLNEYTTNLQQYLNLFSKSNEGISLLKQTKINAVSSNSTFNVNSILRDAIPNVDTRFQPLNEKPFCSNSMFWSGAFILHH